ncbi:MAG TPA: hypothetical protein VGK20_16375 [Candidatus Binatia bacterium]|jgi:parallel beta-helix repeat protein
MNTWLLAAMLIAPVWTASVAMAQSTCVVDTTLDTDAGTPPAAGSLRFCMVSVRSGDTVAFDSTVFAVANADADTVINVLGELPALDQGNVTIDASERRVTVNGSGAGSSAGLVIASDGNRIMGLSLTDFAGDGIRIDSGMANVIGGPRSTGAGSGPNGQGLRLSGNGSFGLEITGAASSSNVIKGCWIGVDASGSAPQPNLAGVIIQGGSHGNTIGGVTAGEANMIGGNTLDGITVADTGSDDNMIIGNVVGGAAEEDGLGGRSSVGNGSAGIFLSRGTNNTQVGGDTPGSANFIGFNGSNGVEIRTTTSKSNSVRGNKISKNKKGGIALFDGSNNGIVAPTITKVQDLGPSSSGMGTTLRIDGVSPQDGGIELFTDPENQGATILGRKVVTAGAWTADLDVSDILDLSATLTDALGDTSRFGVFGLTADDTDGDGVSDVIEGLAGTDPADPLATPDFAGAITPSKTFIKLNFAIPDNDSIKLKTNVIVPPGFSPDGSTLGVYVAGYAEKFTLDSNGKSSSATSSVALKSSASKGLLVTFVIKGAALQATLATSGLTDKTTATGERWVLPIAITTGSSVSFATVSVQYKAKKGKTGIAR